MPTKEEVQGLIAKHAYDMNVNMRDMKNMARAGEHLTKPELYRIKVGWYNFHLGWIEALNWILGKVLSEKHG
jgi:hypothetical protein